VAAIGPMDSGGGFANEGQLELRWPSRPVGGEHRLCCNDAVAMQVVRDACGRRDKIEKGHPAAAVWTTHGVYAEGPGHELVPLDAVLGCGGELAIAILPQVQLRGLSVGGWLRHPMGAKSVGGPSDQARLSRNLTRPSWVRSMRLCASGGPINRCTIAPDLCGHER
jgi:hypothetical protein